MINNTGATDSLYIIQQGSNNRTRSRHMFPKGYALGILVLSASRTLGLADKAKVHFQLNRL